MKNTKKSQRNFHCVEFDKLNAMEIALIILMDRILGKYVQKNLLNKFETFRM